MRVHRPRHNDIDDMSHIDCKKKKKYRGNRMKSVRHYTNSKLDYLRSNREIIHQISGSDLLVSVNATSKVYVPIP